MKGPHHLWTSSSPYLCEDYTCGPPGSMQSASDLTNWQTANSRKFQMRWIFPQSLDKIVCLDEKHSRAPVLVPSVFDAASLLPAEDQIKQKETLRERLLLCVFCCSTATCSSLRRSGRSAVVSLLSGWLPYITESLMSLDRVRVMFWGSQRQVRSPPCWAEPNVSRGCYTVIKNDSVSCLQAVLVVTTEEAFGHEDSPGVSLSGEWQA